MANRDVQIGGNVTGSAVITGDAVVTNMRFDKVVILLAGSVDIRSQPRALGPLLGHLNTEQRHKVSKALAQPVSAETCVGSSPLVGLSV